jgi:indole-3-glycerol phosphate synthase
MNILDTIIAKKKTEVAERKSHTPLADLERKPFFKNETLSFAEFLQRKDKTGIIAEFKRRSPSKGLINGTAVLKEVIADYTRFGASALSVLTDEPFFGGSPDDLLDAAGGKIPVLRKDFIIDEYQVIETKAFGGEIILLIAACLTKAAVKRLATLAGNIGLNVLLEIHDEQQLGHICDAVDVVGINNRDLKSFTVDISRSIALGNMLPRGILKIAESGIDDAGTIRLLRQNGFNGFLMGEKFMKEPDPGKAFGDFVQQLMIPEGKNPGDVLRSTF